MFQKWFAKYARAVSDERERQWLYKKYITKTVVSIIFYLLCFAVIALVLALGQYIEENWALLVMTLVIFAWIGFAVAALCLWISFKRTYNSILNRPAYTGEMPEVTAYRQIAAQDKKSTFKKLWWAWLTFAVCVVACIVCMVMEAIKNPDGEDFGVWGIAATLLLIAGALVLLFSTIFYSAAKKSRGETPEQKAAAQIQAIDGAQGRAPDYNAQNADAVNSYKYLFPDEELCARAEEAQAKYTKNYFKALTVVIAVAAVVVVAMMFFENIAGYGVPAALTLALIGILVFVFTSKQRREINELEKLQKQQLDSNPAYAKNLEWYNLYYNFSKVKGKTVVIFYVAGIILGWVLAVLYPASMWSAIAVAPVFIGVLVYNAFYKDLREKAAPIEFEIGAMREVRFTFNECHADESARVYYSAESQSIESDGARGEISLYLVAMYIAVEVDKTTNQVVNFFAERTNLHAISGADIPAPKAAAEGRLYVEKPVNDLPSGTGRRINFSGGESYDACNKIYMVGIMDEALPLYKILANVYVQLSPIGTLNCILCTDIG